ncbi:MAG TPA: heavy metal translocating P-type ATPase metal-binding domain-containing protein [Ignavibacteria bacterium]|nr:heavy metal translocating P-type ATPase metal-binding domain-containing protein [Ignavibacteria bacterium]
MPDKELNLKSKISQKCFHCGMECNGKIESNDKYFCCNGCKNAYETLENKNLCNYYKLEQHPGNIPKQYNFNKFRFLENKEIASKLCSYEDENTATLTLYIPSIHCTSCIWLLENLQKINPGVLLSRLNFNEKKLFVKINKHFISTKQLFELLYSLGYEPVIEKSEENKTSSETKKLYYKIGIAGFCFGNIMLLSFPEYLSSSGLENIYKEFFGYLNILFAIPLLYCASGYFISSYKGLKNKNINIDVPIALGISIVFLRSLYEILSGTGAGYYDSFSGLILFLLVGKLLQTKTYDSLNFERNYKSYFPLAVTLIEGGREKIIPLEKLKKGDRITVKNNEIIPADSILFKGNANIDYSFVTGESIPAEKVLGEIIYAGGKQLGSSIELEVIRDVSQSYLTQLWNNEAFNKTEKSKLSNFADFIGKNFTIGVFAIVFLTALYWFPINFDRGLSAIIAVLIVACPCAFAISIPFAFGNSMKIFGRNKFYIKNINVIERLADIDKIVFDKTGTITCSNESEVKFIGRELSLEEKYLVNSLSKNSTHPYSRIISNSLPCSLSSKEEYNSDQYKEYTGKGIAGIINCKLIKLGSEEFVYNSLVRSDLPDFVSSLELEISDLIDETEGYEHLQKHKNSNVFLSINTEILGYFEIKNKYKNHLPEVIDELKTNYSLAVLSGDNNAEKQNLKTLFGHEPDILFNQSAQNKLNYIKEMQSKDIKCLMIGDGLNDAGALKQSNVGISVVDNINSFSPSCDGILESEKLQKLPAILSFAKKNLTILKMAFTFSLLYNAAGMYFAISGQLSPLVAAILMPVSSISVVLFATLSTNFFAKKYKLI